MIGSWSNRIIEESRCHLRDRHALDMTNLDVNYVALGLTPDIFQDLLQSAEVLRHRRLDLRDRQRPEQPQRG